MAKRIARMLDSRIRKRKDVGAGARTAAVAALEYLHTRGIVFPPLPPGAADSWVWNTMLGAVDPAAVSVRGEWEEPWTLAEALSKIHAAVLHDGRLTLHAAVSRKNDLRLEIGEFMRENGITTAEIYAALPLTEDYPWPYAVADLTVALEDAERRLRLHKAAEARKKAAAESQAAQDASWRAAMAQVRGGPASPLERELVEAGFKALALKHHPDRGGDTATMAELNRIRKKLGGP